MSRATMFYDGGCPMCRREVGHYRHLDRNGRIDWVDISADPSRLEPWAVDLPTAMRRLHAVDPRGTLVSGVRAFVVVWEQLPYYRWLAILVRRTGTIPLLEWFYRRFADWRFKRRCRDGVCGVDPAA